MRQELVKLLLIEDDASLREILAMNLEDFGYVVTQAKDGEEGLHLFREKEHDLVLTDMRLPGVNGLEVLTQILAVDKDAVVLMLTAFGGADHALEAMQRGAFHYVEKPVNIKALVHELERALEHRRGISAPHTTGPMVASSPAMNKVLKVVDRVATSTAPVMILGESGVGKELVARAIHERSGRAGKPFVALNCAAIPAQLLESMLFGYEKGAFTGATSRRAGKFIAADGGTLFLDEIAEMSPSLQSKLLRVLQDGLVERVGAIVPERVDVRILTATHQDLASRIEQGEFRQDLYYRLHVVPIQVPSLRERREDIPVLMRHFLRLFDPGGEVSISPALDEVFMRYAWPGNVRELRNVMERIVLLREENCLGVQDVPQEMRPTDGFTSHEGDELPFEFGPEGVDLVALEKKIIQAALARAKGNQSAAARLLKVPRHILVYRCEKFELDPNDYTLH